LALSVRKLAPRERHSEVVRVSSSTTSGVRDNGLDVYDPTTGEIRSDTTDEIACWFIDSDYNEESFFVRHAYFTGADEPYKKLQRALKAEIDEAAWSSLYSTVSRPFDPPSTGKIAVKVINHYGDEVLKVYGLREL
jgi:adenine-specific DNA-methyltransferase